MLQGAIYLGTTKNLQGSWKFASLRTVQIITRKQFTPIPMPIYLIKQVDDMYIKEYRDEDIIFTGRNGSTLEVYKYDFNTHDITT